jgi:hypothetical protein
MSMGSCEWDARRRGGVARHCDYGMTSREDSDKPNRGGAHVWASWGAAVLRPYINTIGQDYSAASLAGMK